VNITTIKNLKSSLGAGLREAPRSGAQGPDRPPPLPARLTFSPSQPLGKESKLAAWPLLGLFRFTAGGMIFLKST
jgi:hypothetical protein